MHIVEYVTYFHKYVSTPETDLRINLFVTLGIKYCLLKYHNANNDGGVWQTNHFIAIIIHMHNAVNKFIIGCIVGRVLAESILSWEGERHGARGLPASTINNNGQARAQTFARKRAWPPYLSADLSAIITYSYFDKRSYSNFYILFSL